MIEWLKRESVFSSNEQLDDVNTSDLRYLLTHYYVGSLLLKLVVARDQRLTLLRRARAHMSVFIGRCKQLGLFSDADAEALERLHNGMTAQQKRDYKVERFKRQKATRAQMAALVERRQQRQKQRSIRQSNNNTNNTDSNSSSDNLARLVDRSISSGDGDGGDDDDAADAGFGDESEWRKYELLQIDAALLDSSEQLETASMEFEMLEQIAKRQEAAGGELQLKVQMDRARDAELRALPPPKAPVTIMPGQLAALDRRQQIAAQVTKPGWTQATYTPEEAAMLDMKEGKFLSGGGNDPSKRREQDNNDADDDNETDEERQARLKDEDDSDAAVKKARDWDDYKDE